METREAIIEKQKEYCNYIIEVANKPLFPRKIENLNALLTKYYQFCERYQLETYNIDMNKSLSHLYILESEPLLFEVDREKIEQVIKHLKEIFEKQKMGILEGITEEEAKLLLDFIAQSVRKVLIECGHIDLLKENLKGKSKLTQALSLNLLKDLGLKVSINDDTIFTCHGNPTHYFGTVILPILENNVVTFSPYLIDLSYREFFTLESCHEGLLNKKSILSPDVGYFICKMEEGKCMATQLLKNGYVKLTQEVAKLYGLGFAMKSLQKSEEIQMEYLSMDASSYVNALMNQNGKLDLDQAKLEKLGYKIELPDYGMRL